MAELFRWYIYTEDSRCYQVDKIDGFSSHVRVTSETGHTAVIPAEQIRFVSVIPHSALKVSGVEDNECIFSTGRNGLQLR